MGNNISIVHFSKYNSVTKGMGHLPNCATMNYDTAVKKIMT